MTVQVEHTNSVQKKLKIQVPATIVSARLNDYFKGLSTRARIPGFRPGKAPANVVKQHYGQDAAADLSERLISEFLMEAVREHQLELAIPPLLIATDLPSENKDFNFEVEVHLKPQLPKVSLSALSVEIEGPAPVVDAQIDQELEALRESDATFADIKEARAVGGKDCVVITYSGELDGVKDPKMAAEQQTALIGQNQFLPDFEIGILGMSIGETKTFDVGFPGDYQEVSLQGKTAKFTLTLNGIKEKILPEMTDAFAKQVDPEVQSLLELKLKIRKQLEDNAERSMIQKKRDAVGDLLVAKNPFEVSKRQVEGLAEKLAQQTHQMMHQMGLPHDETEEHAKMLFESSLKKAERDIRLTYILEAISKEQKFEVSSEDIKKRFEDTAKRTGYSVTQIQSYYAAKEENETTSRMDRVKIDIQDEKSLDYALSQATIKLKG